MIETYQSSNHQPCGTVINHTFGLPPSPARPVRFQSIVGGCVRRRRDGVRHTHTPKREKKFNGQPLQNDPTSAPGACGRNNPPARRTTPNAPTRNAHRSQFARRSSDLNPSVSHFWIASTIRGPVPWRQRLRWGVPCLRGRPRSPGRRPHILRTKRTTTSRHLINSQSTPPSIAACPPLRTLCFGFDPSNQIIDQRGSSTHSPARTHHLIGQPTHHHTITGGTTRRRWTRHHRPSVAPSRRHEKEETVEGLRRMTGPRSCGWRTSTGPCWRSTTRTGALRACVL